MHAVFKAVEDMTPQEKTAARRLTLPQGEMKTVLTDCGSPLQPCKGNVGLIYDGDTLVAWGLAWKYRDNPRRTVYLYTRESYRRQGLGTWLFKEFKIRYKNVQVSPWDRRSASFYLTQKVDEGDRKYAKYLVGAENE